MGDGALRQLHAAVPGQPHAADGEGARAVRRAGGAPRRGDRIRPDRWPEPDLRRGRAGRERAAGRSAERSRHSGRRHPARGRAPARASSRRAVRRRAAQPARGARHASAARAGARAPCFRARCRDPGRDDGHRRRRSRRCRDRGRDDRGPHPDRRGRERRGARRRACRRAGRHRRAALPEPGPAASGQRLTGPGPRSGAQSRPRAPDLAMATSSAACASSRPMRTR